MSTDGYSLSLFLNKQEAAKYECKICHKICNNPVQLNCNLGHIFCDFCISLSPHTVINTESIFYDDASNKSNEFQVTTTTITCPLCNVTKCTKIACPIIAESISLLQIECDRCQWIGNIQKYQNHLQTQCMKALLSCPFAAVGCNTHNLTKTEYFAHIQNAQMEHLQLQINAITQLQVSQQTVLQQIQTLNAQQINLTALISEYERKINTNNQKNDKDMSANNKKLLFIKGSNTRHTEHHQIMALDLEKKQKYKLCNDSFLKTLAFDIEFSAFCMIQNIDSKIIQSVVQNQSEKKLFFDKGMNENKCTVLLRCGGSKVNNMNDSSTSNEVNGCCINNGIWINSFPNLKKARYGASAVYSQRHGVLVVGGKGDNVTSNEIEQWNVCKRETEWKCITKMSQRRYSPCCALSNVSNSECLFVGGGWNNNQILKSCEFYDFEHKYWTEIASMNVNRYAAGCTLWNMQTQKICVGGGRGINGNAAQSVEEYDMHKDVWTQLPLTRSKHRDLPCLWVAKENGKILSPFHGLLFIAGDKFCNQSKQGNICGFIEVFDYRDWRKQWFLVEDLRNILIDHKDAVIRGMIPL